MNGKKAVLALEIEEIIEICREEGLSKDNRLDEIFEQNPDLRAKYGESYSQAVWYAKNLYPKFYKKDKK